MAELRQQLHDMALAAAGERPLAPPPPPPREPAAPAARAPAARGAATTFIVDSDGDGAPGGWARDGGDAASSSPHAAPASAAAAAAADDGDDSDDSEAWLDAPAGYSHYATRAVAEELGWVGGPLLPPERHAAGAKRPRGPAPHGAARARDRGGGDARFRDD